MGGEYFGPAGELRDALRELRRAAKKAQRALRAAQRELDKTADWTAEICPTSQQAPSASGGAAEGGMRGEGTGDAK